MPMRGPEATQAESGKPYLRSQRGPLKSDYRCSRNGFVFRMAKSCRLDLTPCQNILVFVVGSVRAHSYEQ